MKVSNITLDFGFDPFVIGWKFDYDMGKYWRVLDLQIGCYSPENEGIEYC